PRSTLFPYTTLFRSHHAPLALRAVPITTTEVLHLFMQAGVALELTTTHSRCPAVQQMPTHPLALPIQLPRLWQKPAQHLLKAGRSEEHTSELQSREN